MVLYLLLAVAPIALMVLFTPPSARSFLRELSVSIAFGALAILGLQLVLTARLRRLKAPYGIDTVYHFHKSMSLVALFMVLTHVSLLVIDDPGTLRLFNVVSAPTRARLAVLALLALFVIVISSAFRRGVRLNYEAWRYAHGASALILIGSAVAHVELVGYYVNSPFKRWLWLVYPAAWIAVLVWSRIVKPVLLLKRPWFVESVTAERGRSWTLGLRSRGRPMEFDPGQFVWLHLGSTPFAMAEHPFSISSSAERGETIELTIKESGDFTSGIADIEVGQKAYVDGPYGQFSVDRHRADAYVFVAGGVGITPIMSMLRTLRARGDRRTLVLIYAARSFDDMVFFDEITEIASDLDLEFVPVPQRPPPGWGGESGRVDSGLLSRYRLDSEGHVEYFICGPEKMLKSVSGALRKIGVHPSHVRYELFGLV